MLKSDQILAGLHHLHPKLIDLSLERLLNLLEKLGNPHRNLPPVIHIAGTNGKGSTSAYIKTILQQHQKKVHAYTSPHLVNFHERINLSNGNGTSADISEAYLIELLNEVIAINNCEPITFFEITSAVAFLAFSRIDADYLILEVGLGGRFDTTNVIETSLLSIITPISIDHVQFLGDKLEKIAFEKAGIIKQNGMVLIGPQEEVAYDVINQCAQSLNATCIAYGVEFQAYQEHDRLIYQTLSGLRDLPLPALMGAHQIQNASTAIKACEIILQKTLDETLLSSALKQVKWPARFQPLNDDYMLSLAPKGAEIWLDGGHNAAGGMALAAQIAKLQQKDPRPFYMLIGMMNSKQAEQFLQAFNQLSPTAYCMAIAHEENSFTAEALAGMAINVGLNAIEMTNYIEAFKDIAKKDHKPARILICGSLYQAGNILADIQKANKWQ